MTQSVENDAHGEDVDDYSMCVCGRPTHTAEDDALTAAVAVTIARVRCEALHGQTNNGRCAACIAWSRRNAPRHMSRFRDIPPARD